MVRNEFVFTLHFYQLTQSDNNRNQKDENCYAKSDYSSDCTGRIFHVGNWGEWDSKGFAIIDDIFPGISFEVVSITVGLFGTGDIASYRQTAWCGTSVSCSISCASISCGFDCFKWVLALNVLFEGRRALSKNGRDSSKICYTAVGVTIVVVRVSGAFFISSSVCVRSH